MAEISYKQLKEQADSFYLLGKDFCSFIENNVILIDTKLTPIVEINAIIKFGSIFNIICSSIIGLNGPRTINAEIYNKAINIGPIRIFFDDFLNASLNVIFLWCCS